LVVALNLCCIACAACARDEEMGWLRYALGLLLFNGLGVLAAYALQRLQGCCRSTLRAWRRSAPDSAFNTAVSFVTNTNWQGYGGERR
jgi:K+-transporting ATPase ATPase A chain